MRINPLVSLIPAVLALAVSPGCSHSRSKIDAQAPPISGILAHPTPSPTAQANPPQDMPDRRLMIVSIDGLRPEFYLSNGYDTPTLKWLRDHGAFASAVIPVYPTVTYPNHTTMVTGVSSAKHGVFANTIFSFTDGPLKDWYWNYGLIRVPTLWTAAAKEGLSTAALGWPVTVGAPINFNVPEIFNPSDTGPSSWELTRRNSDRGLLDQIEAASPIREFHEFADHDVWMAAAAISIWKTQKPNLLALHLVNADHEQHGTGRDSKETHAAIARIDRQLKTLIDSIDLKRSTLFVLGDHGFTDFNRTLNFNALFAKKGWLTVADGKITDWRVIAHSSGGVAAIYVRDESLKSDVTRLLRAHSKGRFSLVNRERLTQLKAYPEAFCSVDPLDGFSVGSKLEGPFEVKEKKTAGNHGYLPSRSRLWTGFIAVGPGIPAHHRIGTVKLVDIAPTAAGVLKIDLPGTEGDVLDLGRSAPVSEEENSRSLSSGERLPHR